ncbi:MAG: hypothetical protein ONB27_00180 [candidate division KSB1 bacterium]|nr:hypothetical protein [candidate division KSB1 bacterium]
MKPIKWIIMSLLMLVMTESLVLAQSPFQAGVHFAMGFPQGEFANNVNNNGYGLSGHFGYQFPGTPLTVGASLGFLIYGMESRREALSPNIPDIVVEVETTNNILTGHLMMRVQPIASDSPFKPYLEGLFGFNYLWTETRLKDWDWDEDDDISSKNYDDAAMSYGGGAGLMIRVYQGKKENSEGFYSINVDLGARYLFGGEAAYLKKGDIKRLNNQVIFTPSRSTTDLLMTNIGVTFNF